MEARVLVSEDRQALQNVFEANRDHDQNNLDQMVVMLGNEKQCHFENDNHLNINSHECGRGRSGQGLDASPDYAVNSQTGVPDNQRFTSHSMSPFKLLSTG